MNMSGPLHDDQLPAGENADPTMYRQVIAALASNQDLAYCQG
jgi:hypothetical protein